jgi:hypothetical protein
VDRSRDAAAPFIVARTVRKRYHAWDFIWGIVESEHRSEKSPAKRGIRDHHEYDCLAIGA